VHECQIPYLARTAALASKASQLVPVGAARTLAEVRQVVNYGLKRQWLLADIRAGRVPLAEACDAHPYLRLAAQHYGEDVRGACPVCRRHKLRHVHYVYGDSLGKVSGQAKSRAELERMRDSLDEFDVYDVEVCRDCGWNHLIRSFVLGTTPGVRPGLRSAADG
jgi:Family of unknown function (DUF5318)